MENNHTFYGSFFAVFSSNWDGEKLTQYKYGEGMWEGGVN